jgi:hypothetical protein
MGLVPSGRVEKVRSALKFASASAALPSREGTTVTGPGTRKSPTRWGADPATGTSTSGMPCANCRNSCSCCGVSAVSLSSSTNAGNVCCEANAACSLSTVVDSAFFGRNEEVSFRWTSDNLPE